MFLSPYIEGVYIEISKSFYVYFIIYVIFGLNNVSGLILTHLLRTSPDLNMSTRFFLIVLDGKIAESCFAKYRPDRSE